MQLFSGQDQDRRFSARFRRPHLIPWAIGIGIFLVYVAFPTRDYYWDGISFAQTIEDSTTFRPLLFHPNHLLYSVFGFFLHQGMQLLGVHIRALHELQIANSGVSAATAILLFHLIYRLRKSLYWSSVVTLLFAFSPIWWKFSTDADAYILSVFFLVATFCLLLSREGSRPFAVGCLHACAMLFHQLAFVFTPVVVLGMFLLARASMRRRAWIRIVQYLAPATLLTAGIYGSAFFYATGHLHLAPLLHWTTSHAVDANFSYGLAANLGFTVRYTLRLLFLTKLRSSFALDLAAIVCLSSALALVFLWVCRPYHQRLASWASCRKMADRMRRVKEWRLPVQLSALWVVCYMLFLFFWLPDSAFYRLFYLPAIVILGGLIAEPVVEPTALKSKAPESKALESKILETRALKAGAIESGAMEAGVRYCCLLLVFSLALMNFFGFIWPLSREGNNPSLVFAQELHGVWNDKTVVYYHDPAGNSIFDWVVKYFNPQVRWVSLPADVGGLDCELAKAYGGTGTVWIESSAVTFFDGNPELHRWLLSHLSHESPRKKDLGRFRLQYEQLFPDPKASRECAVSAASKG